MVLDLVCLIEWVLLNFWVAWFMCLLIVSGGGCCLLFRMGYCAFLVVVSVVRFGFSVCWFVGLGLLIVYYFTAHSFCFVLLLLWT